MFRVSCKSGEPRCPATPTESEALRGLRPRVGALLPCSAFPCRAGSLTAERLRRWVDDPVALLRQTAVPGGRCCVSASSTARPDPEMGLIDFSATIAQGPTRALSRESCPARDDSVVALTRGSQPATRPVRAFRCRGVTRLSTVSAKGASGGVARLINYVDKCEGNSRRSQSASSVGTRRPHILFTECEVHAEYMRRRAREGHSQHRRCCSHTPRASSPL